MFSEKKRWETDAGNISNYSSFDKFVYRNGSVDAFLNDAGKFFVIAAKGIGKTLLLSYKRYLLEKKYASDEGSTSVIFIPSQHPYISFIESIKTTLSKEHISKFKDWEYCKKFWVMVIELSVLSYAEIDVDAFLSTLPPRAQRQKKVLSNLLRTPNTVEYIFNEIINFSESTITQFIQDNSNCIGAAFLKINKGIIMFFDRFDNALETAHDQIWQPIQVGLLEAAWDVMRSSHHVKIYLSIRQEAYVAHRSRNANAISASVVKIEYSQTELRELLNHLVKYYENEDSIEELLGFSTFPNTVTFKEENVFEFMYRYSIGRPRDFVQFCDELSKAKNSLYNSDDEKRMALKEKVRSISSNTIIFSLFDELRMLLKCLTSQGRFDDFLTLLKSNILSYEEMKNICSEFNGYSCIKDCKLCTQECHPFCDLYNMGLLGVVNATPEGKCQKFKTPYDNFTIGLRSAVDYFLIHPALREYINELHQGTSVVLKYELYTGIRVGTGLPWAEKEYELYSLNKLIAELKDVHMQNFFKNELTSFVKNQRYRFPLTQYNRIRKCYPIHEQRINDSLVEYFSKKKLTFPKPISIFISYAFDNQTHKERVESFVEMLRQMGFNAHMDSSLKELYPDIDQMMTVGLRMDKIIIVLSEEYKRKADNALGGVWKEFKMIADDLEVHPQKYIFISFESYTSTLKSKTSPSRIANRWIVDLVKGKKDKYSELISFIKEEKEYPFSEVNKTVVAVTPKMIKPFT